MQKEEEEKGEQLTLYKVVAIAIVAMKVISKYEELWG